jgi:hypothetical protein
VLARTIVTDGIAVERDRDPDTPSGTEPPKRPKINRGRYGPDARNAIANALGVGERRSGRGRREP